MKDVTIMWNQLTLFFWCEIQYNSEVDDSKRGGGLDVKNTRVCAWRRASPPDFPVPCISFSSCCISHCAVSPRPVSPPVLYYWTFVPYSALLYFLLCCILLRCTSYYAVLPTLLYCPPNCILVPRLTSTWFRTDVASFRQSISVFEKTWPKTE